MEPASTAEKHAGPAVPGAGLERWRSFHLFYHGDRQKLPLGLAGPVSARLLALGLADRFYFLHYGLGGPHLRLRLRALPGRGQELATEAGRLAAEFLAAFPSVSSVAAAELEQRNTVYLRDSGENDAGLYPDNTWLEFPPQFEVERYGGPELFPATLDFFTLSSLEALHHLEQQQGRAPSRQVPAQLRFLIRQAWGFARDAEEFARILGYPQQTWGQAMPALVERGDAVFEKQGETLRALLRRELESLPAEPPPLAAGSLRLGRLAAAAPQEIRGRIGSSHLHMSANRLGLGNPDEVYLGRILSRAVAAEMADGGLDAFWSQRPEPPEPDLAELVSAATARFAAATAAASCASEETRSFTETRSP